MSIQKAKDMVLASKKGLGKSTHDHNVSEKCDNKKSSMLN